MGMVDISKKKAVERLAVASGRIYLQKHTLEAVIGKKIKKGDPLSVAEVAAISAVKKTPELIPHCHQILIEKIDVDFQVKEDYVEAMCTVKTTAKTGVEMEALVGVANALNTIWDMVKYLEKEKGQYPHTKISDIMIIKKTKGVNDG